MQPKPPRAGETVLPFDPADRIDAGLTFIGRIRSGWKTEDCPKNIGQARATGKPAEIVLADGYAPGLAGLSAGQAIIVTYWMDRARRDLIVQAPRHADGTRGTFALRSPVRPNSLSMATVVITNLDIDSGLVGIDAIDCLDGTPLVDIKPWLPGIDVPPGWHPVD